MGIRFGWILIVVVAVAQVGLLAWGGYDAQRWLTRQTQEAVERQTVADNRAIAEHLSQRILALQLKTIEFGGPGWHRLQELVETTKVPNDGYVSIISATDGSLLCHPAVRRDESLSRTRPGQVNFLVAGKEGMLVELVKRYRSSEPILSGTMTLNNEELLTSAAGMEELNAVVLVHQKKSVQDLATAGALAVIRERGMWAIGAVCLLGMFAGSLLLWSFSAQIPRIQREADEAAERRSKRLISSREAVIFALAKLAESRDSDTGEHLERIRFYSDALARQLADNNAQIDDRFLEDVGLASALHDIGKAGIPDAILLKPGRLTEQERAVVQKHSAVGGACLSGVLKRVGTDHLLQMAVDITTFHHERWDGAGYPTHRRAEDIPLAARIVSLADVYDALTSQRPYKPAFTHQQAREIIVSESGKHFDPQVVEAFLAQEAAFEQIRSNHQDFSEKSTDAASNSSDGNAPSSGTESTAKTTEVAATNSSNGGANSSSDTGSRQKGNANNGKRKNGNNKKASVVAPIEADVSLETTSTGVPV